MVVLSTRYGSSEGETFRGVGGFAAAPTRPKPFQTQLLRQSTDDNDGGDGGSCEEFGDNPEKNTSVGWRLEGEDKGTGGCLSVATM